MTAAALPTTTTADLPAKDRLLQTLAGYSHPGGPNLSEKAFAELVHPYFQDLRAAAYALLACEDHSEDAVQETLISLWQQPTLPSNLRAWLLCTVRHRALHLRRTCLRRRKHEEHAGVQRCQQCAARDPALAAEAGEVRSEVEQALAQLPLELRQVFLFREVDDMDYEAMAQALRVPVGTVRSRLNRARARLRDLLRQRFVWN